MKIIITESQYKLIMEASHKYEAGCLMLQLDEEFNENWDSEHLKLIDKNDVYDIKNSDFGYEKSPHCTVLFGFTEEIDIDELKIFLEDYKKPFNLTVKSKTIFKSEDYDVLKYDVDCKELVELNKKVKEKFPNKVTYPNYHPHITIAYLKPGKGKKYIGDNINFKIIGTHFKYSDSKHEKGIYINKKHD